jgi:hypothetical protein
MFGISFFAPVFQLIILGYAATFDVSKIQMAVCDLYKNLRARNILLLRGILKKHLKSIISLMTGMHRLHWLFREDSKKNLVPVIPRLFN